MNFLLHDKFIRIGIIFHLLQTETALFCGKSKMYTFYLFITDTPSEGKTVSRRFSLETL